MNPFDALMDKIQSWRYGQTGITGLNQMQNNVKMLVIIVGPFLGVWTGVQFVIANELVPEWFGASLSVLTVIGWLGYCGFYYSWVKTDASNYKGLPQATLSFPDGGVRKFDFMIEPEGIKARHEFPDGALGVEINLLHRYMYQAKNMAFPYVFQSILSVIPAKIGETFKFNSSGEFWHKGMIVTMPNCEHVTFYIFRWVRELDENGNPHWKPAGVINDCSYNYGQALEGKERNLETLQEYVESYEADLNIMLYQGALKQIDDLQQWTATLEDTLETALKQGGVKVKGQVDDVLEMVRSRVHTIGETGIPWQKRIFKLGNLLKFGVLILIAYGVWAFLHFVLQVI